jgi:uncharacterized protein (DUF488 family)
MPDDRPTLFTIGHSNHSPEEFAALLSRHGITAVADVRSQPYGRLEHFRREDLAALLKSLGVEYVFLGQQLGARRDEPECYEDGVAVYERIAGLGAFQEGLERLRHGAKKYRLAILCAEKEPLDCHRAILIARCLHASGARVLHIHADGRLEEHAEAERRLVRELGLGRTLFEPHLTQADLVERAYAQRGREIAYHEQSESAENAKL